MAETTKTGRNEPCPCGSGRKYKHCCGGVHAEPRPSGAPSGASQTDLAQCARQASELIAQRRFEEAIAPLARAATLAPHDAERVHDLGVACLFTRRVPQAVECLRRAASLRPDNARVHFSLGLALQQLGDDVGALASFGRAVQLAPDHAEAHSKMADLHLRNGRRSDATAAFERAAGAAPGTTFGAMCTAKALATQGRAREAEAPLRELLDRDPSAGEAHLMLGNILSEAGRFDEAAAQFERSLALSPGQATAHHALVSLRRLTEADRPLLARIVARLEATDLAPRQRMLLHFAAGKALDDLGDYAGAIAHFDAANRVRHKIFALDRQAFPRLLARLVGRFTREFFEAHAALGTHDESPVLVLGLPRSGTTLTERIVSAHPSAAGGGELPFWNERASEWVEANPAAIAAAAPKLQHDYLDVLGRCASGRGKPLRVTDKMPANFFWIGLVHMLFPSARFIHCRRNPVDTCLSLYSTDITGNWGFASDRGDLVSYYRDYVRLMDHWRAVLPKDRLLDVDYEAVTAAPEEQARRIIAFAGLPWDPACLAPEKNPDPVRTANKWGARQPIYRTSVERWRNYEPWLGELRELLPVQDAG